MPIMKKLKELFDQAKVSYEVYNHPLAYTAQEIAQKQHFSMATWPWRWLQEAKRCICLRCAPILVPVKLSSRPKMNLFPDSQIARLERCHHSVIFLACPFYVDPTLAKDESIYFNAGNHVQTVRLLYRDFAKLVKPRVVRLVEGKKKKAA
jgi:Ala-tRNA(Pro) deacylase